MLSKAGAKPHPRASLLQRARAMDHKQKAQAKAMALPTRQSPKAKAGRARAVALGTSPKTPCYVH
eukprot:2631304-Karenia_brevis.AAC.1